MQESIEQGARTHGVEGAMVTRLISELNKAVSVAELTT